MNTVTLSSKYQLVIPREVRKRLDLEPGAKLTVIEPEQSANGIHSDHVDKYLQLCPHCKKPTPSAFEKSVIDSAIFYLNGKRVFNNYQTSEGGFLPIITFLLAIGVAIYILLNNL